MDIVGIVTSIIQQAAHEMCAVVIAWAVGKVSTEPEWAKALKALMHNKTVTATATDKSETK